MTDHVVDASKMVPPPHLLKKFSEQARVDSKKRGHSGYCKTFAKLCIDWALNPQPSAALEAQPEPVAPTDEELIGPIMSMIDGRVYDNDSREIGQSLRELIARWGDPTPQPVAVSERLPGAEDCDAEGRCWVFDDQLGLPSWTLIKVQGESMDSDMHWLPANALPTPEATNG